MFIGKITVLKWNIGTPLGLFTYLSAYRRSVSSCACVRVYAQSLQLQDLETSCNKGHGAMAEIQGICRNNALWQRYSRAKTRL